MNKVDPELYDMYDMYEQIYFFTDHIGNYVRSQLEWATQRYVFMNTHELSVLETLTEGTGINELNFYIHDNGEEYEAKRPKSAKRDRL